MRKYRDADEKTLVKLTLLGEGEAFEELVRRHERAVGATALKITGNKYSAEDASQDAFVSAWINLASLRDPYAFKAWVCQIAKNRARSLLGHYKSCVPEISFELLSEIDLEDEESESICLDADDDRERLTLELSRLGEKIRQVLTLHYFDGLSVAEISSRLSLPEGTVKWRLSEGRKQLRKGYGIMEKKYNENESMTARVMRQVEQLKLWRLKNDMTGFEEDYRVVLSAVESLDDSAEKSHALADTLLLGYWWVPGVRSDEMFARIKAYAISGHNEQVMQTVVIDESEKLDGREKIDFMLGTELPFLAANGFTKTMGYTYFWAAYEYYRLAEYGEAIKLFEKVLEVLNPTDIYYATARAAMFICQKLDKERSDGFDHESLLSATGEYLGRIGERICLLEEPGFGGGPSTPAIFWQCAGIDSIIIDFSLKVGESLKVGDSSLTYTEEGVTVDTPAGCFKNCSVYTFEGSYFGNTFCRTWYCPGVGIVKQSYVRYDVRHTLLLSSYCICGGEGLLPLSEGNRWEYVYEDSIPDVITEDITYYEVTGCQNGKAAISGVCYSRVCGYADTFMGQMLRARRRYCYTDKEDEEHLSDVTPELTRAGELARTPRERRYHAIASDVMSRIFKTDPEFTPDCTERGCWNFFEMNPIIHDGQGVKLGDDMRYSFEWKNMSKTGEEGKKMLYSFLYDIITDATGGYVWSDSWVPGCPMPKGDGSLTEFWVTDGETVETPAGVFENCRKIELKRQLKKGGGWYRRGRMFYWYAPGVGIVKFSRPLGEEHRENIWLLTEYKGVGEGYFPTDDGLLRRYEPRSISEEFRASVEYTFDRDESGTVVFRNATGNVIVDSH